MILSTFTVIILLLLPIQMLLYINSLLDLFYKY